MYSCYIKAIPGLCFAGHSVCWIHAINTHTHTHTHTHTCAEREKQKERCQLSSYCFPTQDGTRSFTSQQRSTQGLLQSHGSKSDKKNSPTYFAKGLYFNVKRSPHHVENVRMWERRGESRLIPHTHCPAV